MRCFSSVFPGVIVRHVARHPPDCASHVKFPLPWPRAIVVEIVDLALRFEVCKSELCKIGSHRSQREIKQEIERTQVGLMCNNLGTVCAIHNLEEPQPCANSGSKPS